MPFYTVKSKAMLIEANDPIEAAMAAYGHFEDRTPNDFEVTGPDVQISHVTLAVEQQDEAITIAFSRRAKGN